MPRLDASAAAFARQQRAKGFSWPAIAAQIGCSEADLTRFVERPLAEPAAARAEASAARLTERLRATFGLEPQEAQFLTALLQPAGMALLPGSHEAGPWRRHARAVRRQLGAFGLANAIQEVGSGWLVSRDHARKIRHLVTEAARV